MGLMDALPVGLVITDASGGIVRSKGADEKIWGPRLLTRTVDDYVEYKAWWAESGEPVRPEEWASAQAVREGRTVVGQVLEIQRFDGTRGFILNSPAPIRDSDGKNVGSAVAIQDITERKQAEQARQEREAVLAAFLEQSPTGLAILNTEGRIVMANAAFRRYVPETMPSRDPSRQPRWRSWDAQGKPIEPSNFHGARALRGEHVAPGMEFLFTGDDGTEIWTRVSAFGEASTFCFTLRAGGHGA